MFCKNCGNQLDDAVASCPNCGTVRGVGNNFCPNCGAKVATGAAFCATCGMQFAQPAMQPNATVQKSKIAAGLLGLFLGGWGVHNFYLGFTTKAVIQLILTIFTCGIASLWGFIEGIMILAGSIKVDANGVPLKD